MTTKTIQQRKEVTRTWKSGNGSITVIIPKPIAKEFDLINPCHVTIESTNDGVLLKKLDLR